MRILITGSSGLLGRKVCDVLSHGHEVGGTYKTKPVPNARFLDITDQEQVQAIIRNTNPDVVLHTAALVSPDICEKESELAWAINVKGTQNIVEVCKASHTKIIYLSTDYVFDGDSGPYAENSNTNPINYYGLTKLEGERAVKEELYDYALVRPTILYGYNGENDKETFVTKVRKALQAGELLAVDDHVKKYPLLIDDLARIIQSIIEKEATGVFHVSGPDRVTRYEWALHIAQVYGLDPSLLQSTRAQNFARRPYDAQLVSHRLNELDVEVAGLLDGLRLAKMQEECTFKFVYRARPDETILDESVALFRINLGRELAKRDDVRADIVVPVPESGIYPATGYSEQSGMPFLFGLVREEYAKRTLFEPQYRKRLNAIESKLIPVPAIIKGKRVVLVDEAILSGSTSRIVVRKLKDAGATEVHLRITAPPMVRRCPAWMQPSDIGLIASDLLNGFDTKSISNVEESYIHLEQRLAESFEVNSLKFLRLDGLRNAFSSDTHNQCLYCFLGGER